MTTTNDDDAPHREHDVSFYRQAHVRGGVKYYSKYLSFHKSPTIFVAPTSSSSFRRPPSRSEKIWRERALYHFTEELVSSDLTVSSVHSEFEIKI